MTEQEAMGYLQTLANRIPLKFYTDKGCQIYDDFSQVTIKALEKQIPKEPFIGYIPRDLAVNCGGCNSFIGFSDQTNKYNYCPKCGQAIKWD